MTKHKKRGQDLANLLNNAIDEIASDDMPRSDVIMMLAEAAGIESGTVNQILNTDIDCPPLDRLESFSEILDIPLTDLVVAAEMDGCSYEEERQKGFFEWVVAGFSKFFGRTPKRSQMARAIKDVSEWDGSASQWPDTDAYCADCLIDVNDVAGRDQKVQSHCFLPIREPGDDADTYVRQAVFAAAGGRGITQVEKPADVPQADWDTAVEAAANEIIAAYEEMDRVAPESIWELAGRDMPEEARCTTCFHDQYQKMTPKERTISMGRIYDQIAALLWQEDMARETYTWIMDLYWDQGFLYALLARDGMLFRRDVTVMDDTVELGGEVRVFEQFTPTFEQSRTIIRQRADGRYQAFMIASVAVLNRVGEIDSTKLYDSFIEHINRTGDYPIVTVLHLGNASRIGQANYVTRDGYTYILGYLFDDTDFGRAAAKGIATNPEKWGNSIEFLPKGREMLEVAPDIRVPVYTQGVNTAVTVLPEQDAASLFTSHTITRGKSMNEKAKQVILELMDGDEELADRFAQVVDNTNDSIRSRQLIARNNAAVTDAENHTESDETNLEEEEDNTTDTGAFVTESELVLDDDLVGVVVDGVVNSDAFKNEIGSRLSHIENMLSDLTNENRSLKDAWQKAQNDMEVLRNRLHDLGSDAEQKKQEWVDDLPTRKTRRRVTYRASENRAPENGAEKKGDPGTMSREASTRESSSDIAAQTLQKIPNYLGSA